MSTLRKALLNIAQDKPVIEEQIHYIRSKRKEMETWKYLVDPNDVRPENLIEVDHEIVMLREIEENLITMKVKGDNLPKEADLAKATLFTWPKTGDSVMILMDNKCKSEWVDGYVLDIAVAAGVQVMTYWGQTMHITDPNKIKKGKEENNG